MIGNNKGSLNAIYDSMAKYKFIKTTKALKVDAKEELKHCL
jgi:hypothetical protein